jgi:hypothetical protein
LASSAAKDAALADHALLQVVVEFKEPFYHFSWAQYDLVRPATFRLVPPENQRPTWERDYWAMREMFYR